MIATFWGNALKHTNGDKEFKTSSSSNLLSLIDELGEKYGASFKEFLLGNETCLIIVNGKGIQSTGGLHTPLNHNDKIDILPFVSAG